MNNMERIAIARLANNIPEDAIVESMAEWNRRKRKVIKDQHPVFRIQIWVPDDPNETEGETSDSRDMHLWWTNFFTEEQTEPMPEDFKPRKKSRRKKK